MLRRVTLTCTITVLALLATAPVIARAPVSRLRPQNPRIVAWLANGVERSPTMRALIARIEASDVLVYLVVPKTLRSGVSASLTFMGDTAYGRMVRVSVRPDLSARDTIAMIAHELQHVVELADHPDVRTEPAFEALFRQIGHPSTYAARHFDTRAALETGDRVRLEFVG